MYPAPVLFQFGGIASVPVSVVHEYDIPSTITVVDSIHLEPTLPIPLATDVPFIDPTLVDRVVSCNKLAWAIYLSR